jgi:hypothetical protein
MKYPETSKRIDIYIYIYIYIYITSPKTISQIEKKVCQYHLSGLGLTVIKMNRLTVHSEIS